MSERRANRTARKTGPQPNPIGLTGVANILVTIKRRFSATKRVQRDGEDTGAKGAVAPEEPVVFGHAFTFVGRETEDDVADMGGGASAAPSEPSLRQDA